MKVTITLFTGNDALEIEGSIAAAIGAAAEFAEAAVREFQASLEDGKPPKFASAVATVTDARVDGHVYDSSGSVVGSWVVWKEQA